MTDRERVEDGVPMLGPAGRPLYLTEYVLIDGSRYAGPDVEASSWKQAEERARLYGSAFGPDPCVVGVKIDEVPA